MVDDYGGYKQLFANGMTELACWAHARRKFFDAWKASGSDIAKRAITRIAELYAIDAELQGLDAAQRQAQRCARLGPRLDAFKQWLDATRAQALGNSGLAKAIDYTLRRWPALIRVCDDGRYPIDNNPVENAIRPITLGRNKAQPWIMQAC